jgi:ABC-type polysaccharide/polyol phosphate transport system ATPase subunit
LPVNGANRPVAIEVRGLSKTFRIATRRADTLKERMVHPFRAPEYRKLEVLRNLSFEVGRGEFFGVVGRNGSGKSTLLKVLASVYRADSGRIRVAGKISPIIELGVGFHPEMSARDNVITNGLMLGFTPAEARRRFDAVIEFAELEDFVDMKLKNYSSGMRARLAFAIAIQVEPDVLLLDEVLAVGDPPFAQRCQETFEDLKRRRRSTVVLVTHSVPNIVRHCDRAMMLEAGRIDLEGDPSEVGARYTSLRAAPHPQFRIRAPVKIVRMGAVDPEGNWTETVVPRIGQPLALRLVLDAEEPLESAQLRLWLTSSSGTRVFAPPPIPLEGDADRLGKGEQVYVSVRIENRLAAGRYNAHALVTSGEGIFRGASEIVSTGFDVAANGRQDAGLVTLKYEVGTRAAGSRARSR